MQKNIDELIGNRRLNPFEYASALSKLTFWWLREILILGLRRPIETDDIYRTLKSHQSKALTDSFSERWDDECTKRNKPKLTKILRQIYAKRVIGVSILFTIINISIRSVQPQFIGYFVHHLSSNGTITSTEEYVSAWLGVPVVQIYGVSIIVCSFLSTVISQPFNLYLVKLGMGIRLVCCSLIYRKILRLSKARVFDGLNGKVINLMSTDVAVLDQSLQFVYLMWKGPLEMCVFGYMIYREIGVSGGLGVGFIAALIPIQVWVGRRAARYRLLTTQCSDERVKMMKEVLCGIQLIKMYTWEQAFYRFVDKARNAELKGVRGALLVKGILTSFNIVSRMAIFLSIVCFVMLGNVFSARQVFIVTTYLNFLYDSMVFFWPLAITSWTESQVGLKRIEEFLLMPEKNEMEVASSECGVYINCGLISDEKNNSFESSLSSHFSHRDTADEKYIIFDNCSVNVGSGCGLKNIELKMKSSCALIGDVGSGKSLLLKTILGELPIDCGNVTVSGSLSYAAQEPWLFQATVRQNIVFTEPFDAQRYAKVLYVCALENDLQQWPLGDQTIVGERGVSLSGGQRARINLARAVYREADIYLLDDSLAAVDPHVGKFIAKACFQEFLSEKIVMFVTHQLHYAKTFNKLVVMNDGEVGAQGDFNHLTGYRSVAEKEKNIEEIDDVIDEMLDEEESDDYQMTSRSVDREPQSTGAVKMSAYTGYFKSMGCVPVVIFAIFMLAFEQFAVGVLDYYVSHWVNWENELQKRAQTQPLTNASIANATASNASGSNVTTTTDDVIDQQRARYIYIYCGIVALVLYLVVQRVIGFVHLCSRASEQLHARLIRGIMRTTMQFFCLNNSGRILNRFSKDISIIDTNIPASIYYSVYFLLQSIATLVLITLGNVYLLVLVFVLTGIFLGLRHIYVCTARSMKRIEVTARSPMFSHVNATIDGLSTIQVHNNSLQPLCNEFDALQDDNISAGFIFVALSRALSLWIELVNLFYISTVITVFLYLGSHTSSGSVGLAITQILFLGTMSQWGIKQTADLENYMTSVERVQEYANLPSETEDAKITPDHWPANGIIKFKSLSLRYTCDAEPMLRDLNLEIDANMKVAIVGRTGAGKSSIVQALFRFAPTEGSIEIDGIDIASVSLRQLRQSITIIAQEPILFSGTIRDNLDPLGEYSDGQVWNALDDVELKNSICRTKDGLATTITNGGANFSVGQRQLICLARAVLRQNKIVILDEATANVDCETDKIVQRMIDKKFANSTVLAITHRMHTVMSYDKILVMDAGRVVEYDSPRNLLRDGNGIFNNLIRQNSAFSHVQ